MLVMWPGMTEECGQTYSQVTRLPARIAATACSAATQTQSGAVSLDVAETLAVIALLRWIHCQYRLLS